jgi:hypothetical protein
MLHRPATLFVWPRIDSDEPKCAKLTTERAEPQRAEERSESELPKLLKLRTEMAELRRAVERSEQLLLMCANDKTETAELRRAKLRILNELPISIHCITETFKQEPTIEAPWMLAPEPMRANWRKLIEEPKCEKLKTETAEPMRP